MNLAALQHRPESEDCFLYTADELRVRLHVAVDDVAKVTVLYGDPYWQDRDGVQGFGYQEQAAEPLGEGQVTEYWGTTLRAPFHRIQYLFAVTDRQGETWLFGDRGIREDTDAAKRDNGNYFRVPYFHEIDRVKTPDWVKETVWYQIFPERFANGDKTNDPEQVKPWQPTDHPGREDFYGGDLQGVLDHLADLQALGINGLYFCPIFTATSNHKYDTIDYLAIDPAFGDKTLFRELVDQAHARGMKVMLDAVFNHLGYQSPQWQDVVAHGRDSKYASWFHINDYPVTPFRDPSLGKGEPQYDTFAFEPHMPKLNTAEPAVQDFLLNIATYWIREFDIDAWRLDVANEVDHHFWRRFHDAAVALKPDFYIVGEVWHSGQPWLNGDQFSGIMNYAFTQQIEDHFLTHHQDARTMVALLTDQLMKYRDQTDQVMLNMLDSHDTTRLLTLANGDEALGLQALTFMFMQTGAPCIYYGTEMGMSGGPDPDNRKPLDWAGLHGQVWGQVHDLIACRRRYAGTFGTGRTRLTVMPNGLIQVVRTGRETITAYFNTTQAAQPLVVTSAYASGYAAQQLAPKGYVITVE